MLNQTIAVSKAHIFLSYVKNLYYEEIFKIEIERHEK
jgi:hypothetical protein